jgi:hypothetical protein
MFPRFDNVSILRLKYRSLIGGMRYSVALGAIAYIMAAGSQPISAQIRQSGTTEITLEANGLNGGKIAGGNISIDSVVGSPTGSDTPNPVSVIAGDLISIKFFDPNFGDLDSQAAFISVTIEGVYESEAPSPPAP